MSKVKNLVAGLGGAIVLNILHESLKKSKFQTPRIDLLGEEALQKTLQHVAGTEIKSKDNLYKATLAGDVVSNALYYSAIGAAGTSNVWAKAVGVGLAAGIGAVTLPEPMGLNDKPVNKSTQTKVLTVGYYVAGALVTAALLTAFSTKNRKIS